MKWLNIHSNIDIQNNTILFNGFLAQHFKKANGSTSGVLKGNNMYFVFQGDMVMQWGRMDVYEAVDVVRQDMLEAVDVVRWDV